MTEPPGPHNNSLDGIPSAPVVLYVQGVSNPGMSRHLPVTQATVALVLSIVGLVMWGLCTAVPGVIMANTAMAPTPQFPCHPDHGLAKAAKIVGWITIGLCIAVILLYLVLGVFLVGAGAANGEF